VETLPSAALAVRPAQTRLVVVGVSLNPILKLSAVLQHNPWHMLKVVMAEEAAVATANSEIVATMASTVKAVE